MLDKTAKNILLPTTDVLNLTMTVSQALAAIKSFSDDLLNTSEYYVVTDSNELVGKLRLSELLRSNGNNGISELVSSGYTFVEEQAPIIDIGKKFKGEVLNSIPVVDDNHKFCGVITQSTALGVLLDEDQEDMERIMGISGHGSTISYRNLSVFQHMRNRMGWLVGLAMLGFVSGSLLMQYESMLDKLIILAIYLPMISDTGGNAGGQSSSIIIRALSLGELTLRDVFKILKKECQIAIGLSLILAFVTISRVWFFTEDYHITGDITMTSLMLCVGLALSLQVILSTLIGALLPFIATYFKQDPAVVASPAITTIVDISGLLIYFSMANLLLF